MYFSYMSILALCVCFFFLIGACDLQRKGQVKEEQAGWKTEKERG